MKTGLEMRWALFPIKDGTEVPSLIVAILEDLQTRGMITAYGVVNMYGGQNIEVWYAGQYVKPAEKHRFRSVSIVQRLNERCKIEHNIVEFLKKLNVYRTPA